MPPREQWIVPGEVSRRAMVEENSREEKKRSAGETREFPADVMGRKKKRDEEELKEIERARKKQGSDTYMGVRTASIGKAKIVLCREVRTQIRQARR